MTPSMRDWPTASCCGEPRVTPQVDRCYDHAECCDACGMPADDSRLCPTCSETNRHPPDECRERDA